MAVATRWSTLAAKATKGRVSSKVPVLSEDGAESMATLTSPVATKDRTHEGAVSAHVASVESSLTDKIESEDGDKHDAGLTAPGYAYAASFWPESEAVLTEQARRAAEARAHEAAVKQEAESKAKRRKSKTATGIPDDAKQVPEVAAEEAHNRLNAGNGQLVS